MSTIIEKDWQLAQIFSPSLLRFVHYFVHFSYPGREKTPSGSRALATSLCGRRLGCGTSPRVKRGGGRVLGVTSRGRGNSLRLAETRPVLDINLMIFFEKCAKNRKKCEILARRGTSWHVFLRGGRALPCFLVCDCDRYGYFVGVAVKLVCYRHIRNTGSVHIFILNIHISALDGCFFYTAKNSTVSIRQHNVCI